MADVPGFPYTPPPRPVWPLVLVGVAVVLLAVSVGAYFYLRDSLAPQLREQTQRTQSISNARMLAALIAVRSPRKGFPPFTGKRFIVSLVASGDIDARNPQNLEVLFSPADATRSASSIPDERWAEVTKEALKAGLDVDDLTSYVGPAAWAAGAKPTMAPAVPILGDLNFGDGAVLAFTDGSARFLDRAELGLGPDDPIQAGPDSKSALLRQLSAE